MRKNKLVRGFKQTSEKKSQELRVTLSKSFHERLPALILAKHLKTNIISPTEIKGIDGDLIKILCKNKNSHWSAVTININGKLFIILNSAHSACRKEIDIFHELAHIICNHEMGRFQKLGNLPLRSYDERQEEEAKWLGGCLHIPRKALEWALKNKMNENSIAEFFCASLEMVNYRLNVTGVKKQFFS
jgi:Zn-dependent peptidase ImmA (M78 family)